MKKKIQNKLGTYLAVTAGIGCAASVAKGAIVVVDLSSLTTATGVKTIPGLDNYPDFDFRANGVAGYINAIRNRSVFYSDSVGIRGNPTYGRGYQTTITIAFPNDPDQWILWHILGDTNSAGFKAGENWVAFKDTSNKFGWLSFTLKSLGVNNTLPITSFGKFVYDDTSTSPANAITLQQAVAAASVPEPSGLMLLALGATGLVARRQRKKAA
jgi:PEP-CTERM motif